MRDSDLSGLLIVDKPGLHTSDSAIPGAVRLPTSHDIVQRVRRLSKQRRIGHTGTLDPFASGVLVLCLGQATRLVEYYQGHDKQYLATIALGVSTDTYDSTGSIVSRMAAPVLAHDELERVLARFIGAQLQLPPIYSALKQDGESLHHKARRGESITVAPRSVHFHQIDLLDYAPPERVLLRVRCSAGTYIRSLAHDLGVALGTVAHLAALRREAAGAFSIEMAHTMDAIETAAAAGRLTDLLLPLGAGLDLPALLLPDDAQRRLAFGQIVTLTPLGHDRAGSALAAGQEWRPDQLAQGLDAHDHLMGIVRCMAVEQGQTLWKAEKWLGLGKEQAQENVDLH